MSERPVTREEFDAACAAIWTEMQYRDSLVHNEAMEPQGFATLGRVYLRRLEDAWANHTGLEPSLLVMRKLATIFILGVIRCGIRPRKLT